MFRKGALAPCCQANRKTLQVCASFPSRWPAVRDVYSFISYCVVLCNGYMLWVTGQQHTNSTFITGFCVRSMDGCRASVVNSACIDTDRL